MKILSMQAVRYSMLGVVHVLLFVVCWVYCLCGFCVCSLLCVVLYVVGTYVHLHTTIHAPTKVLTKLHGGPSGVQVLICAGYFSHLA
jgi:hypothetical protein